MEYVFTVFGISLDIMLLPIMTQSALRLKHERWKLYISLLAYGIFLLLLNTFELTSLIRLPFSVGIVFIILWYFYERIEKGGKLTITLLYIVFLSVPEFMIIIFVMFCDDKSSLQSMTNNPKLWFTCFLLAKIFTYMLIIVAIKIYKNRNGTNQKIFLFIQVTPLVVTWLLLINITFVITNFTNISKRMIVAVLGMVTVIVFLYTMFHIFYFEMYSQLKLHKKEIVLLEQKNEMQYQYYREKMIADREMQNIYHDLNNVMLVLKKKQVDVDSMVDKMQTLTEQFTFYNECGNEMLNIILSQKKLLAKKDSITVKALVRWPDWCELNDFDICTIFGNLLDNAIEAVRSVQNVNDRKIDVRVNSIGDTKLVIKICNTYCESNIIRKERRFLTTKPEKAGHGIGLGNVKEVVNSNHGECSIKIKKDCFEVVIIFYKMPDMPS